MQTALRWLVSLGFHRYRGAKRKEALKNTRTHLHTKTAVQCTIYIVVQPNHP